MKLVRLYIENFGGLSRYSLEFREGLTVIQEPNGFGKTTLAEFIRAMFYGFPRKAKTLDKSKRQKYTPWSGGKCGGNLVFELEGEQYRIERTFGATPRSDTFQLIDLRTGRKSDRFSEEIGMELFQLDADSFERSTYLPQLHDGGSLTTDNIQAKLGDLVEDPNDVGNFDKAMTALRTKRSALVPYRGNGGSVAEAAGKVSRLQEELDRAEARREELAACRGAIAGLEEQQRQNTADIETVRQQITQASEAETVAAVHRQFENLAGQQRRLEGELARLRERYPGGIPEQPQIELARQTADRLAALSGQQVTSQADLDAARFLEENRSRFGAHLPTREELDACQTRCGNYQTLRIQAESTGLSQAEKQQYDRLLPVYESGALEEARLDALTDAARELLKTRQQLQALSMSPEEDSQLSALKRYFVPGVPEEETIQARLQDLAEAERLRQENERLAARLPARSRRKESPAPAILLLLLGVLGVTLGIVLLTGQNAIPGGVCLGAGALALIGGVILSMKGMVSREFARTARTDQDRIDINEKRIASLEETVRGFVERYTRPDSLADGLREIQENRGLYRSLAAEQTALLDERRRLTAEAADLEARLQKELGGAADYDRTILELRLTRTRFEDLLQKKAAGEADSAALLARCETEKREIAAFLDAYSADGSQERFQDRLAELRHDRDEYLRARARTAEWEQRKAAHAQAMAQCRQELDAFFAQYALDGEPDPRKQLQQLRDDRKTFEENSIRLEELTGEKAAYAAEHEKQLAQQVAEHGPDPEEQRRREEELTRQAAELTRQLLEQRQRERNLREQIDRIPQLRDELERWQEQKTADQEKSRLLDETMDFLQKAKDSLSTSYLGPIRRSFAGYLNRLAGEQGDKILVTPDLDVKLERQGQARELAFFSAGQTDLVMLCMRLALVDALFTGVKPFVILDDPFVNLDDQHTAEALSLLQDLARERQIVYLTCNSSRSI